MAMQQEYSDEGLVMHSYFTAISSQQDRRTDAIGSRSVVPSYDFEGGGFPQATFCVLIGLLCIWALEVASGAASSHFELARLGARAPWLIWDSQPWRLVTATFLHFSLAHLLSNALALWWVGSLAESIFGKARYLVILAGSALIGSVVGALVNPLLSVGISGAICGVWAADVYYIMTCWKDFSMRFRHVSAPMLICVPLFFVVNGFFSDNVDTAAHVGGSVGGLLLAWLHGNPAGRNKSALNNMLMMPVSIGFLLIVLWSGQAATRSLEMSLPLQIAALEGSTWLQVAPLPTSPLRILLPPSFAPLEKTATRTYRSLASGVRLAVFTGPVFDRDNAESPIQALEHTLQHNSMLLKHADSDSMLFPMVEKRIGSAMGRNVELRGVPDSRLRASLYGVLAPDSNNVFVFLFTAPDDLFCDYSGFFDDMMERVVLPRSRSLVHGNP